MNNKLDVLIAIHPKWIEKIFSGEKTIEVRKSNPKRKRPFKTYIYCTKGMELWGDGTSETWRGIDPDEDMEETLRLNPTLSKLNGKVVGEFVCRGIMDEASPFFENQSCLMHSEIAEYAKGKPVCGWRIDDLKIYDKPKELKEFRAFTKCPQAEYCMISDEWYCNVYSVSINIYT